MCLGVLGAGEAIHTGRTSGEGLARQQVWGTVWGIMSGRHHAEHMEGRNPKPGMQLGQLPGEVTAPQRPEGPAGCLQPRVRAGMPESGLVAPGPADQPAKLLS